MYTDTEKKVGNGDVHDGDELETESTSDMAIDDDQIYSHRNASIAGMTKDLSLDIGFRYSTIVLVFFATYVSFQPIAAILIRKLRPRLFLSTISLLWGITVMGFGFVNKYKDMVGLRVVLGIFESGIYPGIAYLLSTWYTRYDVGKRFSVFYIIGCIANAFGGILAYGLMQMDGLGGKAGWRWIFIMEGLFVLAAILIWFSAYFGDRYHIRGPIIIINCLIALIGLPIMSFAKSSGVRYFGVFLLTAGSNANVPTSLTYQANNIRGQWTRAFSSALFVGFAGMGGISGGTIFRSQDKPKYVPGVSAAIA
ncbi:MAG: hypothetical protein LQ352_004981 [Teloschistes flavicans]|nr:MAG: hypothetical protein LQ352_004981 [Teloschistes flavicans]